MGAHSQSECVATGLQHFYPHGSPLGRAEGPLTQRPALAPLHSAQRCSLSTSRCLPGGFLGASLGRTSC